MIFVDAGVLFSLVVSSEEHHEVVQKWYEGNKDQLITSDYCVDELLTLLLARNRSSVALSIGWKIFNEETCRLHFLTPEQIRRAWVVFQAKHTLGWSFTDCTSKVVIEELGVRTAASTDQHFRQFGTVTVVP